MCSVREKSQEEGHSREKHIMSESTPDCAANKGSGKVPATDWEEDLDLEEETHDTFHLRSASVASHDLPERLEHESLDDYMGKNQSQSESDSESENEHLGDLVGLQPSDAMASQYGTSMPKPSFFSSLSHRGRPIAPTDFWKKASPKFFSPKTFQTAQSSLASYSTAPSGSFGIWKTDASRGSRHSATRTNFQGAHGDLIGIVVTRILTYVTSSPVNLSLEERRKLEDFVALGLSPVFYMVSEINVQYKEQISVCIHDLVGQLVAYRIGDFTRFALDSENTRAMLRSDVTKDIFHYLKKNTRHERVATTGKVFSSEWLDYLRNRGILLDPMDELDWSGKGQHVEYGPEDERDIPLTSEKILGHSRTAIVDSVRCRRIRLARKKIVCNRQQRKEDAIAEVEHLLRLQHAHIVRVVGTYTLRKDLAILLYPAAEMDLKAYMDDLLEHPDMLASTESREVFSETATHTITTFFGCLSNAIAFIHERNVKHMDIKPKNILVRRLRRGVYKAYIADFGIARSYKDAAEAETDSPVSFTPIYAAPEVVLQDTRGFSADVFSLGCVFMEMMATLCSLSTDAYDERQALLDLRQSNSGSLAYHVNIDVVTQWYRRIIMTEIASWRYGVLGAQTRIVDLCPQMISQESRLRPLSSKLKEETVGLSCLRCNAGPEAFEAAD
jgi:serine/threonine protein kinase